MQAMNTTFAPEKKVYQKFIFQVHKILSTTAK